MFISAENDEAEDETEEEELVFVSVLETALELFNELLEADERAELTALLASLERLLSASPPPPPPPPHAPRLKERAAAILIRLNHIEVIMLFP